MYKPRLYAPGPVEVPREVLEATARPVIHHRTSEFKNLFLRVREKLAELTCVKDDVIILAGSGTAAFEAGFVTAVPKGSKVLGINAGKFGERWINLARQYGHEVIDLNYAWGRAAKPADLRSLLKTHTDIAAVMTTHSETSTGVLHDVKALASVIHEEVPDALFLVDCVTSLSVTELRPEAWGLDGIFAGSQKGLLLPPGLAFAWLSERAWQRAEEKHASFYLDLRREKAAQQNGQTAQTPAVNLIYGLEVALNMLLSEGTENLWTRRKRLNLALIEGAKELGCKGYAERISPAVAALSAPASISAPDIVKGFEKRGARIAGGQDHSKPVLFRPSVLGYADRYDVFTILNLLEDALKELGASVQSGGAIAKAKDVLDN